jgi:hypothetical protein
VDRKPEPRAEGREHRVSMRGQMLTELRARGAGDLQGCGQQSGWGSGERGGCQESGRLF